MTNFIQVFTTTETREEAQQIARAVLEKRLAACVQIVGPITSAYWWQGQITDAQEWLCIIKSRSELFTTLEAAIREAHPYQVPEVLAVPVISGSQPYLDWLQAELRDEG